VRVGRYIGNIAVVKSALLADRAVAPITAAGPDDARTRDRVARALHDRGPQSAGALSASFGLTPAAVRRHLDALMAAGRVCAVPERKVHGQLRGRGRPAKLFALTDDGHALFRHAYDDIAVDALNYLRAAGGDAAVSAFAGQRLHGLEVRYAAALEQLSADRRPAALAAALTADGYAASAQQAGTGVQVCQHHCPIAHVAADFPELCEAETQMFVRLLGTHVQRLATIAHGDGICTTHIPLGPTVPSEANASEANPSAAKSLPTTSGEVTA